VVGVARVDARWAAGLYDVDRFFFSSSALTPTTATTTTAPTTATTTTAHPLPLSLIK